MELRVKPEILTPYTIVYGPTFGNAENRLLLFAAQWNTESCIVRILYVSHNKYRLFYCILYNDFTLCSLLGTKLSCILVYGRPYHGSDMQTPVFHSRGPASIAVHEILGGQSDIGTCFTPNTSVFPFHYHSTSPPFYSSSTCCCPHIKTKGRKLRTFQEIISISKIGEH
jgi:hypothetical protein